MKLVLGTVQFGLDYGISNPRGKVSFAEVQSIISVAENASINTFDTASSYGNSEAVLGEALNGTEHCLGKISPNTAPEHVLDEAKQSLKDLNIDKFECISAHHAQWLLDANGQQNYQALLRIKQLGLSNKIGCSAYSVQEARRLISQFDIDVIQLPANLCDQQVLNKDFLALCSANNIELHIRSLFLQGALLMPLNDLPKHLKSLIPTGELLDTLCMQKAVSKMSLLLAPYVQHPDISKIIIGCCSANELSEIVHAYQEAKNCEFNYQEFAIFDDNITNPSKWPN